MKDEKVNNILEMLKRNLNNFLLSKNEKSKQYWANVLKYDLTRLEKRIKEL